MFSVLRLLMLLIAVLAAASPVSLSSRARIEAGKYVEVQCRGMYHTFLFRSRTSLTILQVQENSSELTPRNSKNTLSTNSNAGPTLLSGKNVRAIPSLDPGRDTDTLVARTGDGNIFPHKYNTRVPHLSPAVDERLNLMPQCNTGQHGKTWLLYPMMEDGKEFRNRTRPGPDRVLVVADGTGDGPYRNYVFCASVFHPKDMDENDRDGSFDTCSET
jgi:hypothetical protein